MALPRLSLNSVRVRLALWNVGVLAFVLIGLGSVLSVIVQANIASAVDKRLSQRAARSQHFFDTPPPGPPPQNDPAPGANSGFRAGHDGRRPPQGPPEPPHEADDPLGELRPRFFALGGGTLMPWQRDLDTPWDTLGLARAWHGRPSYATVDSGGQQIRVYSMPLYRDGQVVGVVQMGNSLTRIHEDMARLRGTLITLIPLVLLIAGLGGAFLTDRALRPVRRLALVAGRIEADNLSRRLPVIGHDEFADLAETFNSMLARLQSAFERQERAFEQQRRFTADASHELRTPLTIIKANTSLALAGQGTVSDYQKTLRAVDTAADRMTRLVQDLLLLARSDADQLTYTLHPTPLAELLAQAVPPVPLAAQATVMLHLPSPPPWVLGHPDTLVRLFSNLIENALRHTPPDGIITVTAEAHDAAVTVTVADTGEGIAPEHLPHLTERFYRIEAARSRAHGGTGLGLAICQSIVAAHGGTLEFESVLGQGTTVRVTLPGAAAASEEAMPAPSVLAAR